MQTPPQDFPQLQQGGYAVQYPVYGQEQFLPSPDLPQPQQGGHEPFQYPVPGQVFQDPFSDEMYQPYPSPADQPTVQQNDQYQHIPFFRYDEPIATFGSNQNLFNPGALVNSATQVASFGASMSLENFWDFNVADRFFVGSSTAQNEPNMFASYVNNQQGDQFENSAPIQEGGLHRPINDCNQFRELTLDPELERIFNSEPLAD